MVQSPSEGDHENSRLSWNPKIRTSSVSTEPQPGRGELFISHSKDKVLWSAVQFKWVGPLATGGQLYDLTWRSRQECYARLFWKFSREVLFPGEDLSNLNVSYIISWCRPTLDIRMWNTVTQVSGQRNKGKQIHGEFPHENRLKENKIINDTD